MDDEIYERHYRFRKAVKIADMLHHFSVSAAEAETLSSHYWQYAANLAEVKTPSLITKDEVIKLLRQREALAKIPVDLFTHAKEKK
jgi:hypothetical protein